MKAIKSKDTSIEIALRKALWKQGVRYRKNYNKLPGKPDIAITKYRIAIFCDSEFWHGRNWDEKKNRILSNREYWINKIEKNIQRDINNSRLLKDSGWIVLRFWGKEIEEDINHCIDVIQKEIDKARRS